LRTNKTLSCQEATVGKETAALKEQLREHELAQARGKQYIADPRPNVDPPPPRPPRQKEFTGKLIVANLVGRFGDAFEAVNSKPPWKLVAEAKEVDQKRANALYTFFHDTIVELCGVVRGLEASGSSNVAGAINAAAAAADAAVLEM
jgi:hypothetical protein